jgi:muramoyltetrapeptide carboxypeptidase
MRRIRAVRLQTGDLVRVITPSQPIGSLRNFRRGIKTLESLGFKVEIAKYAKAVFGMYQAGTKEQRAEDINEAFANTEVKAIFMSGGGFLANEVLPLLDYKLIRQNPKIIIGFSDGATLLNAIYTKTGLVTFYGFSIEHFFRRATPYTIDSFLNLVQEGKTKFQPITKWRVLKRGKATGRLIGGNLLSFANLLGSQYFPDTTNSILFLEEHNDYSEDFVNSLVRLINVGIFKEGGVQGIIFGKMVDITVGSGDPDTKKQKPKHLTLYWIIKNLFEPYRIPILANVDFGVRYRLMTIPIGMKAALNLTKKEPRFRLQEPAVRLGSK